MMKVEVNFMELFIRTGMDHGKDGPKTTRGSARWGIS